MTEFGGGNDGKEGAGTTGRGGGYDGERGECGVGADGGEIPAASAGMTEMGRGCDGGRGRVWRSGKRGMTEAGAAERQAREMGAGAVWGPPPPGVGGSAGGVDQLAQQLDDVGAFVEAGFDQQAWAAEPLGRPDLHLVGEQHGGDGEVGLQDR